MSKSQRSWLVTGASGQLGSYVLAALRSAGEPYVTAWTGRSRGALCGYALQPTPLDQFGALSRAYCEAAPTHVIHTAAVSRIDLCHERPEWADCVNVRATRRLAELAAEHEARLVHVSTDLVFDGTRGDYREQDEPRPLSHYGRSKLAAEGAVREAGGRSLVLRISLLYGPARNGRSSFFEQQGAALLAGQRLELFDDEWRTPLALTTAAAALLAAATSELTGTCHLGGPERLSRWDMGQKLARHLGVREQLVGRSSAVGRFPEPRPRDVSLCSELWRREFPALAWPTMDSVLRESYPQPGATLAAADSIPQPGHGSERKDQ